MTSGRSRGSHSGAERAGKNINAHSSSQGKHSRAFQAPSTGGRVQVSPMSYVQEQPSSEHSVKWMHKQRTILRTIPTFLPFPSAAMEIWALRPSRSDCLLPLNHPSTPTTQRPSCDQPPLIPRSQKQNTPYHHRQQTAPTVHTRAWVGMVWHLIPLMKS